MKKPFLILAFAMAALAARAQVSTVRPQTLVQRAFTSINCGSTPATFQVLNIGQASGSVVYRTSLVAAIQIQIIGNSINDVTSAVVISTVGTASASKGIIFQNSYMPYTWVQIASCIGISGSGTVTADYVSSSLPADPIPSVISVNGGYQYKIASRAAVDTPATYSLNSPVSSTKGTLSFTCGIACTTWTNAPTLTVQAGIDATHLSSVFKVLIGPGTGVQLFQVPDIAANAIVVVYTNGDTVGGGSAYDLTYTFGGESSGLTLPPSNIPPQITTDLVPQQLFKCNQQAAINVTAVGAGDSTIVAGIAGENIYVCHIDLVTTAAVTLRLDYAAAGCASGIVAITGLYPAVIPAFSMDYTPYAPLFAPVAGTAAGTYDLCLRVGGATTIGGTVIFAQGIF